MAEFKIPDFLLNHSTEEIFARILGILPPDIDVSEGSHTWNFTRPTALVAAEICEFVLPEVIRLIFPEWSYGEFLDGHARSRGITRRAATAATGELTITGAVDTVVPEGSLFSTASIGDEPSVDYVTTEGVVIPETGSVTVGIRCAQTGIVGNTTERTIVFVGNKIKGITAVENTEDVIGGTEEETDESLIERITFYDATQGESFVGSVSDYKRWATSVNGVGSATIIPAQDDSGMVTIILTDSNGSPATEDLRESVYNYIMRPDDPGSRLAPPNALLSVVAPQTVSVAVQATVELADGATLESVKAAFLKDLALYMTEALEDGEVKYTRVGSVLSGTTGVNDYSDLLIGGKAGETVEYGTANIPVSTSQLPVVDEDDLALTEGAV